MRVAGAFAKVVIFIVALSPPIWAGGVVRLTSSTDAVEFQSVESFRMDSLVVTHADGTRQQWPIAEVLHVQWPDRRPVSARAEVELDCTNGDLLRIDALRGTPDEIVGRLSATKTEVRIPLEHVRRMRPPAGPFRCLGRRLTATNSKTRSF